jgi:hypothetical protein
VQNAGVTDSYDVVWDDFGAGFLHEGPDARWTLTAAGEHAEGDAQVVAAPGLLTVRSAGSHPKTGEPSFTWSTGQEHTGGGGAADHVKFYATAAHRASSGVPGFDAPDDGRVLAFRARAGGRSFGTATHPFGDAVADPDDDLRLAAAGFSVLDPETLVVFDFFFTNRRVYAFYERLPQGPGTEYAAFSSATPVADRSGPDQRHDLEIRYDRAAGTVRWLVDGNEGLRIERIGLSPANRRRVLLDLGGAEQFVEPRQLVPSLGLFTLLDGNGPNGQGLVRISDQPDLYRAPHAAGPTPQTFFDEQSLPGNRLWGQGALLEVEYVSVYCGPDPGGPGAPT